MTEGTEHALEYMAAGILFCMGFIMLIWFHKAFVQQTHVLGNMPNRLILSEQEEEGES